MLNTDLVWYTQMRGFMELASQAQQQTILPVWCPPTPPPPADPRAGASANDGISPSFAPAATGALPPPRQLPAPGGTTPASGRLSPLANGLFGGGMEVAVAVSAGGSSSSSSMAAGPLLSEPLKEALKVVFSKDGSFAQVGSGFGVRLALI